MNHTIYHAALLLLLVSAARSFSVTPTIYPSSVNHALFATTTMPTRTYTHATLPTESPSWTESSVLTSSGNNSDRLSRPALPTATTMVLTKRVRMFRILMRILWPFCRHERRQQGHVDKEQLTDDVYLDETAWRNSYHPVIIVQRLARSLGQSVVAGVAGFVGAVLAQPVVRDAAGRAIVSGIVQVMYEPNLDAHLQQAMDSVVRLAPDILKQPVPNAQQVARAVGQEFPSLVSNFLQGMMQGGGNSDNATAPALKSARIQASQRLTASTAPELRLETRTAATA
jgi:hypothetical protein